MLHLRNQQLYARENRIPRPSSRSRRTVAQSPERFGFSIFSSRSPFLFVPAFSLHHAIFSVWFISDHRSSFVRSVMGVPLLFGREHARKKTGKKTSPLVLDLSLSPRPFYCSFFDWFKFSDFVPFCCPCNHLYLYSGRTYLCAVSKIFHAFRFDKLIHDWHVFRSRPLKNCAVIKYNGKLFQR